MGKKQPLAAVHKQRAGLDITRFLERRSGQAQCAGAGPQAGVSPDGRHVAGVRPPREQASTPDKHLLDNVLLSQDVDDGGLQVVWASSPTAAYSPQKGSSPSQEAVSTSQRADEDSQASKVELRRNLAHAAHRTSDNGRPNTGQMQPPNGSHGGDLLEQLLVRRSSHAAASTSGVENLRPLGDPQPLRRARANGLPPVQVGVSDARQAMRPSGVSAADVDDQVMQDVLAGTDTYKTPAAAKPVGRLARVGAFNSSAECSRPSLSTPSMRSLGCKRTLLASGNKASGGNKRRALLDLLDQVELMVKHQGPPADNPAPQPAQPLRRNSPGGPSVQPQPIPGEGAATNGRSEADISTPGGCLSAGAFGTSSLHAGGRPEPASLEKYSMNQVGPPTNQVMATRLNTSTQALRQDTPLTAVMSATAAAPASVGPVPGNASASGLARSMLPPVARPGYGASSLAATPATAAQTMKTYPSTQPIASLAQGQPVEARGGIQGAGAVPPGVTGRHVATPCQGVTPVVAAGAASGAAGTPAADGPSPVILRPPVPAPQPSTDTDDEDLWDIDIDAVVAKATSRQSSPVCPSSATGVQGLLTQGPLPNATVPMTQQQPPRPAPAPGRPPLHPQAQQGPQHHQQQQQPVAPQRSLQQTCSQPDRPLQAREAHPQRAVSSAAAAATAAAADPKLLGDREEVHFVVMEVHYPRGRDYVELRCFNEYKGSEVRVYLKDMWMDQEVRPGDTVNVVGGRPVPDPTCMSFEVSAKEGLLVLHPDVLLSGTSICTTIRCSRQAWLQARVASGAGGEAALLGSMLHELLQHSLRSAMEGKLSKDRMLAEAKSIISANTDKLLETQQDEALVLAYLSQQLDGIIRWCNMYVTPGPSSALGGRIELGNSDVPTFCRVTEVLDIEESIWAPKYGLKGQLDASLLVTLSTKDPLHNQRTLTGGYASTQQQQWAQQHGRQQQEPARFHGMQQHGGSVTGACAATQSGAFQQWPQQGQAHGHGQVRRQHSWSGGAAAAPGPGPLSMSQPVVPVHGRAQTQHGVTSEVVVAPFEYKTGKDWPEHKAQVLMYLLLMEDRYRAAVRTGLLWNQQQPTMQAVKYAHHELAALIMHRNRLATYLVGAAREPPPPLQGPDCDRKCNYCGVSSTCALYLAASAQGSKAAANQLSSMELHPVLREKIATVTPSAAAFFAHWIRLVDLEEAASRSGRADLWAISGAQRERQGGCIAELVYEREVSDEHGSEGVRYAYVFRRMSAAQPPVAHGLGEARGAALMSEGGEEGEGDGGLLSAGFAPGDLGVLGVEGRHAAAARVSVADVTKDTITLSCKKEIKFAKLGDTCQRRCQCGGAAAAAASATTCSRCNGSLQRVTWRLDRDEAASVFAQMRLNLSLLGVPGAGWQGSGGGGAGRKGGMRDVSQARREGTLVQLQKLVIDLASPQQGLAHSTLGPSSQLSASLASSQLQANPYLREHAHEMNGEQLEAVQRVLAMQDYAILLGMPGSGKTTTIVHVIRALVEARVNILVASYTNSAVDNILLKLVGTPVSFVRIGSAQAVHPSIRPYMPGGAHHPNTSVAGLQELMSRVHVVGCTCLSVHSPLLAGRNFGVCILDEASQITLPASIGALALAKSFLLVGDHYQLSPLVVSREAAQGGLGVSLFRRLSEAHPQAVVTLRSQYRMAADIMALSNELVYNGRMLCGSERVANAKLHLPSLNRLTAMGMGFMAPGSVPAAWPTGLPVPAWLLAALQPESRVVFLDTDNVSGCRELALQDGMINTGEVRLVHALACALVAAGLPPREIGVASPYKAQVATLKQALEELSQAPPAPAEVGNPGSTSRSGAAEADAGAVEVLTVDKYQGRDKSAIMLSFVRCNAARSAGRLLADWQRLNVAITRARTKLLLVGSAATLASMPLLADMLALLRRNDWVTQLPMECLSALPPVPSAAATGPGML